MAAIPPNPALEAWMQGKTAAELYRRCCELLEEK